MIEPGDVARLGAQADEDGVNFAVFAPRAEMIELCLFDAADRESRHALHAGTGGIWHGYVPGIATGQRYGYRAHGRYRPEAGLRFNPAKLLIDPYARLLAGEFCWSPALFDYSGDGFDPEDPVFVADRTDSAAFVPRSVVTAELPAARPAARRPTWRELVIYEANLRGYTMRFPDLPDAERGRFRGLTNGGVVDYLKALGITSIELQPVFEFVDEQFLIERGLRNFWGYNPISFFAPAGRYAATDARAECREMIDALHDAGLEVLLDVVYNHTAEGGLQGPTLSLRGLDDEAYYRRAPGDPLTYINDTGTGNTLDADSPAVQRLVLDSLRYWADTMGVDGFRFDLAPVLGRAAGGFRPDHPLLTSIAADPVLDRCHLIAEPWDPGPGGYQLGHFPPRFAEWNDRYRDSIRRFWRGDAGEAREFAARVSGSRDLFPTRPPEAPGSINLVTAHDGFTLHDLVSYAHRHNEANGEENRDGHAHNFSANYGVEGETDDPDVLAIRRRQRLNLLATLLLSEGAPLLLAGDEFGNTQQGNNNAYAQDNPTGWIDWSGFRCDAAFVAAVQALIALRRDLASAAGSDAPGEDDIDADWLRPNGKPMRDGDWADADCLLWRRVLRTADAETHCLLLFNAATGDCRARLPEPGAGQEWRLRFASAAAEFRPLSGSRWQLPARSIACFDSAPASSRR